MPSRPDEELLSSCLAGIVHYFAIIGGGINGAAIARDAALRGMSVILLEKDDFASGTTSWATRLIHGGLRYLEYYEFRLVREALIEREVLMNAAPHIIWPMRFVLPHSPQDRPAWLVRLGLFLYDHLGGRKKLPGTRTLDLTRDPEGTPILGQYTRGFEYSDCWVDDARLVALNTIMAHGKAVGACGACPIIQTRLNTALASGTCKLTDWSTLHWDVSCGRSHSRNANAITATHTGPHSTHHNAPRSPPADGFTNQQDRPAAAANAAMWPRQD